ncbi:MAG TPA: aminotransferase class IV [Candidatus Norongarragalinales archaeon]|nr:aminotransferase class IV [Candidatus Norongarragalinales archaeon]
MKVCINGTLAEEKDAVIPITDKAYFYDFAVYSSLKVINGKAFSPEYHVDRLFESAQAIGLEHSFTKKDVLGWIERTIKENALADSLLRLLLIGDADGGANARLYVIPLAGVTYYPESSYSKGVKTVSYRGERRIPTAKTKDLLLGFLAMKRAKAQDAIEALLIDNDGNIREGTRSNFFAIKGNALISQPKEEILEGIVHKIVVGLARQSMEVRFEKIPLARIGEYDECFLTSTQFNVMPVRQVDGTLLRTEFKKTRELQKLLKQYYQENVLGAKSKIKEEE